MIQQLALVIVLPAMGTVCACPEQCACPAEEAPSWIFRPSTYSHDPGTGDRVSQFAAKKPAYSREDPTYLQSGYRHIRRSIRGGHGSADRLHVVQTWGAGEAIRPYGEWQRPFRAGATPYGPWGNPQGPWTTPFESWYNPYGLGQLPIPPWVHWAPYPPYGGGGGYGTYPPGQGAVTLPAKPPHDLGGHKSGGHPTGGHRSGHPSGGYGYGGDGYGGHPSGPPSPPPQQHGPTAPSHHSSARPPHGSAGHMGHPAAGS